ncbi:LysR family transcriptional regulator [Shewanella sp. ULN5]|uniref:LysR family transcriptional regulator n=1 Tax=Shewanella sp. ULN5 TaxID=2994678 RepID=UPI00273F5F98|nr:LysR family transcriptional regulator [Shewanella sp. ULN5]MDP5147043.1 LysR family transcriptional regulator [Shewanella sp. ULN5]
MELRNIKHFVTLAEFQHFNRAAQKLSITQPSLSRSIQKLESLVGGKLFERDSKNMSITALGVITLNHCLKIINEHDKLIEELASFHGNNEFEIKIGASPIPSNSLVGPILGEYIKARPSMTLDLKVDGWQSLSEQLLAGNLDVFVAESRFTKLDEHPHFNVIELPPFPVIFCCRPQHPLASLHRLYLASFKDYPLAIPTHLPTNIANQFDDLFELRRKNFAGLVRFDQFHAIKSSIYHSDLVALTPEIAVREELTMGTLIQLTPQLMPKLNAHFSIISLAGKTQSQSVKTFIDFVIKRANSVNESLPIKQNIA